MLRVDHARWGQTPEDLRQLATSAAHQRTRERFLVLYEITQARCAAQVAERTSRHPQTVMEWLHLYNEHGPAALAYQRTGGRPPFAQRSKQPSVQRSARPSRLRPARP
ncbi:MAG: helix-turn-helix domain-containing protein [Planctomycetes bacterium]|nr:helix-turn-helix domain-containing protein [Planctomycetota bacterium]